MEYDNNHFIITSQAYSLQQHHKELQNPSTQTQIETQVIFFPRFHALEFGSNLVYKK
jgi:hypothetical protein